MQIGKQKSHRDNPNQYRVYDKKGCGACLSTMGGGGLEPHIATEVNPKCIAGIDNKQDGTAVCIPVLTPERAEKRQNGRRFKDDGEESFTLTSQDRHGIAISVKSATSRGYEEATEGDSINLTMPESKTRRGRVGKKQAQTLDTSCNQGIFVTLENNVNVYAVWYEKYQCYIAIRKLTPKECFRLQGWSDDYFEKAQFVNSDSQLYKQAGNGVTVNVVELIGKAIAEQE